MRAYYSDTFELPLPPKHRFPMAKYRLLRQAVEAAGLASGGLAVPAAADDAALVRVHDAGYLERVVGGTLTAAEQRQIGFPWSPQLVERSRRSVGGTLAAARAALADGTAVNLAGGTHHAFADRGAGYCVFNDAAVAVRALQAAGLIDRAVIVDCDVHQGDGTAAIFCGDPTVFTLSIHGGKNFPSRKQRSDLDIALPDGTGDDAYLAAVDRGLAAVLGWLAGQPARASADDPARPDLPDMAIYVAGADPYAGDRLGRLAVSRQGLAERDRRVFAACRGAGLPVAAVMAGGYAPRIDEIVAIHLATVREASRATDSPTRPVQGNEGDETRGERAWRMNRSGC